MERYSQGVPKMTSKPPGKLEVPPYQIKRTPTRGSIKGIMLNHNIIGTMVHYYRGRSRPHTSEGTCEACENGNVARWEGYICIWSPTSGQTIILGIARGAVIHFANAFKQHGSLRGLHVCTSRRGDKWNSMLLADITHGKFADEALPKEPAILKILYRIWEIPEAGKFKVHPADSITLEAMNGRQTG